jgi:hypothetical protein
MASRRRFKPSPMIPSPPEILAIGERIRFGPRYAMNQEDSLSDDEHQRTL